MKRFEVMFILFVTFIGCVQPARYQEPAATPQPSNYKSSSPSRNGPSRVGHEPNWSRAQAIEHLRWYINKGIITPSDIITVKS